MVKILVPTQLTVSFHVSLVEFAVRSKKKVEFKKALGGILHYKAAVFLPLLKNRPLLLSLVLLEIERFFLSMQS